MTLGVTPSVFMFWTGVAAGPGVTVLILLNAKPRRPSPSPVENSVESFLAHSTAWFLITRPPKVTVSYCQQMISRGRYVINVSRSRGTISIGDFPGRPSDRFCSRRFGGIVDSVTSSGHGFRQFRREH